MDIKSHNDALEKAAAGLERFFRQQDMLDVEYICGSIRAYMLPQVEPTEQPTPTMTALDSAQLALASSVFLLKRYLPDHSWTHHINEALQLVKSSRASWGLMVNITPPATARDRWMYEQGRMAERDPRSHPNMDQENVQRNV